jgi:hypothetical protein
MRRIFFKISQQIQIGLNKVPALSLGIAVGMWCPILTAVWLGGFCVLPYGKVSSTFL